MFNIKNQSANPYYSCFYRCGKLKLMIMEVMDILIKMENGLIMKNINKIVILIIIMMQNVGML